MKCVNCNSEHLQKDGNHKGYQRYKCMDCNKRFDYGIYENKTRYITHFNTQIKETTYSKLTRENYCIPTNKISYVLRKSLKFWIERHDYKIPNEYYIDENTYTDQYVKQHYEKCMHNYDLNMNYFLQLNHDEFDKYLNSFVTKNKLKEIFDLKEVEQRCGVYILVLDEYNQVYIGISNNNVKERILQHWRSKKEFDRLIYGYKEQSTISIDSFGALDTTRIFFKELKWYQDINEQEENIVSRFRKKYILNRVDGGINSEKNETIRNLKLRGSMKKRKLK